MKPGTKDQAAIYRLDKDEVYLDWRDNKLAHAPHDAEDLMVDISDISDPHEKESLKILNHCQNTNMALYTCPNACNDKEDVIRAKVQSFAGHFGLVRVENHRSMTPDGLVSIEVIDQQDEGRNGFIPYTDKPMSWHTDGYYNATAARIRAMLMHCVRPAPDGGLNEFLDPEIAYIRLRDENPDFVRALSHRRALTIPAFADDDGSTRAQSVGPVFTWDRYTGNLHMRFTDRKRNISWAEDQTTTEALSFLRDVLANDQHVIRYKLSAGQGIICNNVVHSRTSFSDDASTDQGRLLLRARYLDRIDGTC